MLIEMSEIYQWLSKIIWPMFRIGGLLISMPVFNSALLPQRVRLLFVVFISVIISPLLSSIPQFTSLSVLTVIIIFKEILLGLLMGFVFQLVFQVFVVGGQILAMQSGLGFATMVDPSSRLNVPLISQFYLMLVTLVFLSLNGHLMVLQVLVQSFNQMPIGNIHNLSQNIWSVIVFSSWIFKGAIAIVLPAIIALLMVNLTFGVMTKAAPQMNIFTIGFPITLTLGIIIIYLTLYRILPSIKSIFSDGTLLLKAITS